MMGRRSIIGAVVAAGLAVGIWGTVFSSAQDKHAAAPPAVLRLESAIVQAEGDTIRIFNAPTGPGNRRLDITCQLAFAPDGTIRAEKVSAAPSTFTPNSVLQLVPGRYVDAQSIVYVLTGPAQASGGRQVWTAHVEDPRQGKYDATWTTGPTEGHPDLKTFPQAKTLPADFVYGTVLYANGNTEVVGARQIGNTISITSFDNAGELFKPSHSIVFTAYAPAPPTK